MLIHAILLIRWAESPEARKEGEKELGVHLQSLDLLFAGSKFIFDQMTMADIAIFTQLHYLYTVVKHEIPAHFKNVHSWMGLMRESLKLSSLYDFAA